MVLDLGINLPPAINEDLELKPTVQTALLRMTDLFLGRLITPTQQKTYVNFYAYLHQVADLALNQIMDTLESQGLINDTIVVFLSDHGEMGLSHGGLRQKSLRGL